MAEWEFTGPNPIVGYTVGLEFEKQLSAQAFRQISALHGQFKRELPRRIDQQAVTFRIGAGPTPTPTPQFDIGGVTFDSLNPDGTIKTALSAVQNSVSYMVSDYRRWVEFWPVAERVLTDVVTPALNESAVQALTLVANNHFVWNGNAEEMDIRTLLRGAPKYVAEHILQCRGACHSHNGYTVTNVNPPGTRVDNVILVVGPLVEGRQPLELNFSIRLSLRDPIGDRDELLTGAPGTSFMARTLDSLHNLNKGLMRELLLDSVVAGIPGLPISC
jgi:uncharacterized protein (TIGR04255 family)